MASTGSRLCLSKESCLTSSRKRSHIAFDEGDNDEGDDERYENDGQDSASGKERLRRSRERNKIHARRTRHRKKLQVEKLQVTVEVLQTKNAELTRALDEWVAALKLLAMKAPEDGERLLVQVHAMDKRDSVFHKVSSGENIDDGEDKLNGTILGGVEMATLDMDLELVRKDRQECTQQELHQIRRERNRMHAKRARTRKKAQMEELQGTINELEQTNFRIGERIAWLCSKSFRVTYEEKVLSMKDSQPFALLIGPSRSA